MNNLDQFPCYDHSILKDFSFQSITPVSVTIPYDKTLSGSKYIKKKVDHEKGDLVVYSFHFHTAPSITEGEVVTVKLLEKYKEVETLLIYNHIFKGHRVVSIVCQIQELL